MKFLILAQICLTVGTPNWVVVVCYIGFAIRTLRALVIGIREGIKYYSEKD